MNIKGVRRLIISAVLGSIGLASTVSAAPVTVEVTFENLSLTNGLRLGSGAYTFHDNSGLDFFDLGGTLTALPADLNTCSSPLAVSVTCIALISDQVGGGLQAPFSIAASGITSGNIIAPINGVLPQMSETTTIDVDPSAAFFSYIGSVLPSNDVFFGSDNAVPISDLLMGFVPSISFDIRLSDLFDAGLETTEAFGVKGLGLGGSEFGTAQNGVVAQGLTSTDFTDFDTQIFSGFPGFFDVSTLAGDPVIARFTLTAVTNTAVSAPGVAVLMLLGLGGMALGRRRFGATSNMA